MRIVGGDCLIVTSIGKVCIGKCLLPLIWISHLAVQLECI
jgi:hypothetical protein